MINTLNESLLHKKLKRIYSMNENRKEEVPLYNWICDISSDSGDIIEIQTGNLSKLLPKAQSFLELGKKFTIVYPIYSVKYIEMYDVNGNLKYRRKSPKRQSVYDIFRELTGIYQILLDKNFTLEIPEITACEMRQETVNPVQTGNGKRKYLKPWYKKNKDIENILKTHKFNSAKNYLALIPKEAGNEFSAKTLLQAIKNDKSIPAKAERNAYIMLWVLRKMELVTHSKIENRCHFYKIR